MKPRLLRLILVLVAVGFAVVLPVGRPGRAAAMGVPSAGPQAPGLTLLSQSPFVKENGVFHLRLRVTAQNPSTDFLQVLAFPRLTTRTDFDNALLGHYNSSDIYSFTLGVSKLRADPAGGLDVDIPVNQGAPAGSSIPTLYAYAASGIFPIQIGLYDTSNRLEAPTVNTFLVYALPESASGLPKLSVALVVPFSSPLALTAGNQVAPLVPSESARLSLLANSLSAVSSVPYTLSVDPQTLAVLAAGSAADRATSSTLAGAVQGGKAQVLPAAYTRVSVGDLEVAGLDGEVTEQLQAGSTFLGQALGAAPSMSAWVTGGPMDYATLSALMSRGVDRLVIPDSDLSAYVTDTTFARPTQLAGTGASKVSVYGADVGLTADFTRAEPAVLAANQLLAELAMIQVESPGVIRGVVALPPPDWSASPDFVSTLLKGLAAHPLLAPVTTSNLFDHVTDVQGVSRHLATANPPSPSSPAAEALTNLVGGIQVARSDVTALASILPNDTTQVASLENQLLTSESTDLSGRQRLALLDSITAAYKKVTHLISLPSQSSITLTSNRGQIPLTILSSPALKARVELQLTSPRLIFQAFTTPEGRCEVSTPTFAVCQLVLTSENTTLKVPVQTRSSGVFPLQVSLFSPDGSVRLAYDADTVTSTAVSGVGVIVIVLAVLSLGIWWVRDLRHGRRARKLVPSPVEAVEEDPDPEAVSDDPVVNAFFTKPAPEFEQPGER